MLATFVINMSSISRHGMKHRKQRDLYIYIYIYIYIHTIAYSFLGYPHFDITDPN